jgi:hypothetical protein
MESEKLKRQLSAFINEQEHIRAEILSLMQVNLYAAYSMVILYFNMCYRDYDYEIGIESLKFCSNLNEDNYEHWFHYFCEVIMPLLVDNAKNLLRDLNASFTKDDFAWYLQTSYAYVDRRSVLFLKNIVADTSKVNFFVVIGGAALQHFVDGYVVNVMNSQYTLGYGIVACFGLKLPNFERIKEILLQQEIINYQQSYLFAKSLICHADNPEGFITQYLIGNMVRYCHEWPLLIYGEAPRQAFISEKLQFNTLEGCAIGRITRMDLVSIINIETINKAYTYAVIGKDTNDLYTINQCIAFSELKELIGKIKCCIPSRMIVNGCMFTRDVLFSNKPKQKNQGDAVVKAFAKPNLKY